MAAWCSLLGAQESDSPRKKPVGSPNTESRMQTLHHKTTCQGVREMLRERRWLVAMNPRIQRRQTPRRSQRGDVLMEYVILLLFIVLPLVIVGDLTFNPSGRPLFRPSSDYKGAKEDFGFVGQGFHDWYQRLIAGISLPIP